MGVRKRAIQASRERCGEPRRGRKHVVRPGVRKTSDRQRRPIRKYAELLSRTSDRAPQQFGKHLNKKTNSTNRPHASLGQEVSVNQLVVLAPVLGSTPACGPFRRSLSLNHRTRARKCDGPRMCSVSTVSHAHPARLQASGKGSLADAVATMTNGCCAQGGGGGPVATAAARAVSIPDRAA